MFAPPPCCRALAMWRFSSAMLNASVVPCPHLCGFQRPVCGTCCFPVHRSCRVAAPPHGTLAYSGTLPLPKPQAAERDDDSDNEGDMAIQNDLLLLPADVMHRRQGRGKPEENSVSKFVRAINIGFFVLVGLLGVSFIMFFMYSQMLEKAVHQIEECARLQTKSQQAAAWGEARFLPGIRDRLSIAPTVEADARAVGSAHNQLAFGSLSGIFADTLDIMNRPWVPTTFFYGVEHDGHHFHDIKIRSLFDLGYDLANAMNQSAKEVEGTGMSNAQLFVERNAPEGLAHAFNLSAFAYVADAHHVLQVICRACALMMREGPAGGGTGHGEEWLARGAGVWERGSFDRPVPRGQSKTSNDDSPIAPQSGPDDFFFKKILPLIHTSK